MEKSIDAIKAMYMTKKMDEVVNGLDQSINIIKSIVDCSLPLLGEKELDKLFIAERISYFFENYLAQLSSLLNSTNKEVSFWAATIIASNSFNMGKAEGILLDEIKTGTVDNIGIATTILFRKRSPFLRDAILARLSKRKTLQPLVTAFLEEKLKEL